MSQAILVTGGAGYIGSHTVKVLRQKGFSPVVVDDLSTGHRQAVKTDNFVQGSYGDRDLIKNVVSKFNIKSVMHFGGKILVGESVEKPSEYYKTNFTDTMTLLETLLQNKVKTFIFSSSCAVFGSHDGNLISENDEKKPITPYGRTKFFIEEALKDLEGPSGLRSGVLRYFNAAGADPEGELGEDHSPETHLIPNCLKAALGLSGSLTVNGKDYPTPDGSCIRDYVHVTDLALAHTKTLQLVTSENKSFDFNLGSGRGNSVLEIIKATSEVSGKDIPYTIGPKRFGDPPTLVADPTKAFNTLHWTPEFDLQRIIQTAYSWMKSHPHGFSS